MFFDRLASFANPSNTHRLDIPGTTPETVVPTITSQPEVGDRPIFLMWPLPAHTGLARISQYPNNPWTWNYLGLNEGQQCPPMFGYLLKVDSWGIGAIRPFRRNRTRCRRTRTTSSWWQGVMDAPELDIRPHERDVSIQTRTLATHVGKPAR